MSPLFTIITPVFNRASIVQKTIDSVLAQEYTNFEYLLIDDGSSDESRSVLEAYQLKDQRIRVLPLQQNQGRCAARNTGLQNANGKWICYLDSDDQYYPNHLSTFFQLIQEHKEFNVFAVDQHINGQLKEYRRSVLHKDNIRMTLSDFIEDNPLTANQICHANHPDIRWSKNRIPISEDLLFMRNIALRFPIYKKAIVTNNLIEHEARSMNTTSAENFVKYNLFASEEFIKSNTLPKKIQSRIRLYTKLLCVNVFLASHQKKEARKLFFSTLTTPKTYVHPLFFKAILKFILK